MVLWLLQLTMVVHIVAENYVEHRVIMESNCNPFENYIVDYFRMKNDFTFLKEVFSKETI